jgi:branched-chain amino acid transport system ATP-binding protein
MLKVSDLHVHIGKLHILQGVSLDVGEGEAVALLGRNGVGKTTTLRAVLALAKKSAGAVELDGKDLHALPAHRIPSAGIGYVPQGRGIFPNLTVRENLFIGLRGKRTGSSRSGSCPASRASWSARGSAPARSRAASSRCSRSRAA